MVSQWGGGKLGGRGAMDVGDRPQGWLGGGPSVKQPRNFLANGCGVECRELGKNIVRVLMIHERLAVVGLAGLEQFRKAGMGRGQ